MVTADDLSFLERVKIQSGPLVALVKAFEAELGEERARAIARQGLRDWIRELYTQIRAGFDGNPIDFIAAGLPMFGADDALDVEILQQTEDAFDFNITRCRYAEFYASIGEPELGFLFVCDADIPMAEAIGDDVRFERTQTIMQGGTHCDFRYRRVRPDPA